MHIITLKTTNTKPKSWTRKGRCPACAVNTGSKHAKTCGLTYKNIKPKYLACIWCGGNLPLGKLYAMYCSTKCRKQALGQKL